MPTDLSDAHLALRRTLTFRLRAEHSYTFKRIAEALASGSVKDPATGEPILFTVAPQTCREDFHRLLREYGYVPDPREVDVYRADSLRKLDDLEAAWAPKANDDAQAARIVLQILRQRSSLEGTAQVRVTGADGGPIKVQLAVPDETILSILESAIERRGALTAAAPSQN